MLAINDAYRQPKVVRPYVIYSGTSLTKVGLCRPAEWEI